MMYFLIGQLAHYGTPISPTGNNGMRIKSDDADEVRPISFRRRLTRLGKGGVSEAWSNFLIRPNNAGP